jgi:hypothetical protein
VIEGYKAATERYAQRLREGKLDHYNFFASRVLRAKEVIQKELIYRVAKYDEFLTPCQGGTLSYVIMEDGGLKPCEILADTLGQVASAQIGNDFKARVTGKDARALRRRIKDGKCRCTYECAMTTNVLFSWPMSGYLAREVGYDTLGLGSKGEVLRNRERLAAN